MGYKVKSLSVLMLCIVIITAIIYCMLFGFPWTKMKLKSEITQYLQDKYTEKMNIDYIRYSVKENSYYAEAYQKSNQQIKFIISRYKNKTSRQYEFVDNYPIALWESDVNSKLNPAVKSIFADSDNVYAYMNISQNPLGKINFKTSEISVPNYNDIKEQVKQYSNISISIKRNYDKNNEIEEFKRVFKVLKYIKDGGYDSSNIHISYHNIDKENESWIYFDIPYSDIDNIKEEYDIVRYKKGK